MQPGRIILADDHGFVRLGIIQILKDEYPSVEIKEVSDGDTLIKEVMKQDWDLVISDLDMPGKNGLEALEQIKLIKPNINLEIKAKVKSRRVWRFCCRHKNNLF